MMEKFFFNHTTSFTALLRQEIREEFKKRGRKKHLLRWFFGGVFLLFFVSGFGIFWKLSTFPLFPSREVITDFDDPLSFGSLLEQKFSLSMKRPVSVFVSEAELSRLLEGFLQYYPQKFIKTFLSSSDVILESNQVEIFIHIREPINFSMRTILNDIKVVPENFRFHVESIKIGYITLPVFFNNIIEQYFIEPRIKDFFEKFTTEMDFKSFHVEHGMIFVDGVNLKSSAKEGFENFYNTFVFENDDF